LTLRERLLQRLTLQDLELGPDRFEALWSYVELLVKWNRRINLTGFQFDADVDAGIDRLLLEPIAAARIAKSARRVLDVGSGGGSPAIPFFLGLDHSSELVLVESRAKKAVFLREALRSAGIPGRVAADRFEYLVASDPFDVVTVRAVAADEPLWTLIRRTLATDGRLFWFHSRSQLQPNQGVVAWAEPLALLGGDSWVSVGRRVGNV
jgi:16S rRNA (guanine527-N7)-methyltransferase